MGYIQSAQATEPWQSAKIPTGMSGMSGERATGVNYAKGGQDPELKPDSEYPEWLWGLAEPKPSLGELQRRLEGREAEASDDEVRRLWDLYNRQRIKDRNAANSK